MTMDYLEFDGDSHESSAHWFGMTVLFDAPGFAELTIDNWQLTIIVSLRDDFEMIPVIFCPNYLI